MRRSIRESLEDVSLLMEQLEAKLTELTLKEKVDVGARVRAIAKHCESIDESIKTALKARKDQGTVLGEVFKAIISWVPTTRFQQKEFEKADPKTYSKFLKSADQQRITFEPR